MLPLKKRAKNKIILFFALFLFIFIFVNPFVMAVNDAAYSKSATNLFLLIFTLSMLIWGYYSKNMFFQTIAAFCLMALGTYIMINGLNDVDDWLTKGFGLIIICTGAWVGLTANEVFDKLFDF